MDDRSNVSVRNPASNPALKRLAPSGVEHGRDAPSCQYFAPRKHGPVTAVDLTATRKQMREGGPIGLRPLSNEKNGGAKGIHR